MPSALSRLKLLSASFAAVSALRPMMMSTAAASVSPPVAKRVAHTVTFGKVDGENRGTNPMEPVELQDDLFWIRDDTRKNEEVLQLLREETRTRTRTLSLTRTLNLTRTRTRTRTLILTLPLPLPLTR